MKTVNAAPDTALRTALRLIEDAWAELSRSAFVQHAMGHPVTTLPDLSFAEAERKSSVGRALVTRVNAIDADCLPHDVALTLRTVRFRAATWAREAEWYWMVIDPAGAAFFGLFLVTGYCGGYLLNSVRQFAAGFKFESDGDLDRYLALASDYARLIDQIRVRTVGQAGRGIYMPRVQIQQAEGLIAAFRAQVRPTWTVAADRLMAVSKGSFDQEMERRIAGIDRAFGELADVFSPAYLANAPEAVGMGQYPGGKAIYAELLKLHTTLDLTPEEVHVTGHERIATIEAAMAAIRQEVGFSGDGKAYLAHLNQDPRWRADTAEGVGQVFQKYIDRMKTRFGEFFASGAKAAYRAAPLPSALEGSMTFGYYDGATPDHPVGTYLFNAANLTKVALFHIGALNYHELVPGHHLHLSTQLENELLHPFRTYTYVNAYNEAWAEYSATLAGEMGMYPEPEERYGRLVMDAFLTCRLVVDTGMNVLGWSLEQAREYLRAHCNMSETEIRSETIRYSCDIPAQALAYKMGDTKMFEFRARMQAALGNRFDIRQFHAAVLGPGALPMADLDWHLERETRRMAAGESDLMT